MKMSKNENKKTDLIDLSDEDDRQELSSDNNIVDDKSNSDDENISGSTEEEEEDNDEMDSDLLDGEDIDEDSDETHEIILIQKEQIDYGPPEIARFIKFCLDNGYFDDTFYDYGNAFSILATKLPTTFEKISEDGETLDKESFINRFRDDLGFTGDLEVVWGAIDDTGKDTLDWEEFVDFFIPFVKAVTI